MSNQLYKKIKSGFQTVPMILYIGQNITDEALKAILANPWSAVITSRTDDIFATLLPCIKKKRIIIKNGTAFPTEPLSGSYCFVFQPFSGNDGKVNEKKAYRMFGNIIDRYLVNVSQMVIVGYDDSYENEFSPEDFSDLFANAPEESVSFWSGKIEAKNKELLLKTGKVTFSDETLESVLDEKLSDSDLFFDHQITSDDIFYCQNKPYFLSHDEISELEGYGNTAVLLTENTVNRIKISGHLSYQTWFFNFLNETSLEGPQWYGYRPKSKFYVERSYKSKLKRLVDKMLDSNAKNHISPAPVILSGYTCTGKTMTLGALAYEYFVDKKHPVVFIQSNKMSITEGSYNVQELIAILRNIEKRTNKSERIVLFWDSTGYRDVEKSARDLYSILKGEGIRFILVCSAYHSTNMSNIILYKDGKQLDSNRTLTFADFESCDYYTSGKNKLCYYVTATRMLNETEIKSFWNKFREFSGLTNKTINFYQAQSQEKGNTDIFDLYYRMMMLLRQKLEKKILREEQYFKDDIEKEFNEILNQETEKAEKAQWQLDLEQWIQAHGGMDSSDNDTSKDIEKVENSNVFDKILITVAMFSKYGMSLPYEILCSLIKGSNNQNTYFSTDNRKMFDALTHIPFFSYSNTEAEGFSFRYRSALEAKVLLNRKDREEKKQFDILMELMELQSEGGAIDLTFAKCLREYLRLSGPNGKRFFSDDTTYYSEDIERFMQRIPDILEILSVLLSKLAFIADKVGFIHTYITFTREYYGTDIYCKTAEERAKYLTESFGMAQDTIKEIEDYQKGNPTDPKIGYLNDEYQAIITEAAFTYAKLCEIAKQTKVRICNSGTFKNKIYPYLKKIITENPTNGYAYNALFQNFRQMYSTETNDELKMEYLCKMWDIIGNSTGYEIVNRGDKRDELTSHIIFINDCRNDFSITIDRLLKREQESDPQMQDFLKAYDGWLEANNPTAIVFVCRKELFDCGIIDTNNQEMTEEKKKICKKIIDFMELDENYDAIKSSSYSLEFLIEIYWMLYNGTRLIRNVNRQMTYLDKEKWEKILSLCEVYLDLATDVPNPIIELLHALAVIQVNNDYVTATSLIQTMNEKTVFRGVERTRTPFMICDEKGKPIQFENCVVRYCKNDTEGRLDIPGIPYKLGENRYGIYFKINNFGKSKQMPPLNFQLDYPIEIGIGYQGLSAYTEQGRRDWGDKK